MRRYKDRVLARYMGRHLFRHYFCRVEHLSKVRNRDDLGREFSNFVLGKTTKKDDAIGRAYRKATRELEGRTSPVSDDGDTRPSPGPGLPPIVGTFGQDPNAGRLAGLQQYIVDCGAGWVGGNDGFLRELEVELGMTAEETQDAWAACIALDPDIEAWTFPPKHPLWSPADAAFTRPNSVPHELRALYSVGVAFSDCPAFAYYTGTKREMFGQYRAPTFVYPAAVINFYNERALNHARKQSNFPAANRLLNKLVAEAADLESLRAELFVATEKVDGAHVAAFEARFEYAKARLVRALTSTLERVQALQYPAHEVEALHGTITEDLVHETATLLRPYLHGDDE